MGNYKKINKEFTKINCPDCLEHYEKALNKVWELNPTKVENNLFY